MCHLVEQLTPAPFTVLGWLVPDIGAAVTEFTNLGVDHDDLGAWTAPGGARVAWFRDPDGNTLSLTEPPPS